MVNVVRPTGGLTPARPDAVVRIGNQLQGLFWRAGSSYGERVEWRIQRWGGVAVAEAGVAGAAGGELFCGGRSSGEVGVGVRGHGRGS